MFQPSSEELNSLRLQIEILKKGIGVIYSINPSLHKLDSLRFEQSSLIHLVNMEEQRK
jgi:hypothetical protein